MSEQLTSNFKRSEFACKCGCGFDDIAMDTVNVLQQVRDHFDAVITVTSGCRCEVHNTKVGGGTKSQHLFGTAADIVVAGTPAPEVAAYLKGRFTDTYGIGTYNSFTHFDTRAGGAARWDG